MPVFLTKVQNQQLFGKATVEKVSETTIIGEKRKEQISVLDSLKIIVKAETQSTGIVTEQMKLDLNSIDLIKIVDTLQEQVKLMQEANALPQFDMTEEFSLQYFERRTLMDSKEPTTFVSQWDIELMYDEFYIRAYMDTETGMIYQFRVTSIMDEFQMDVSKVKFENFLKYLNIEPSQVSWTVGENKWESNYDEDNEHSGGIHYYCYLEKGYVEYSILFQ